MPTPAQTPTQTPTFEVKKVKTFMGMDCPGYNLDLWMNGELIAHVVNDGSGGCTNFHYVNFPVGKSFEAYCKSLPPEIQTDEQGKRLWPNGLPMDAELFVDRLFERHKIEKKLRNACKKSVLFKLPKDPADTYRTWKTPFTPAAKAQLMAKHPGVAFFNEAMEAGNWFELLTRAPI